MYKNYHYICKTPIDFVMKLDMNIEMVGANLFGKSYQDILTIGWTYDNNNFSKF